jgi:uncharacterized protein with HEPN domain
VRRDDERLADILDALGRIRRHMPVDDRSRFDADEVLQNAVLRWIEVIGEAARGIDDQFRASHPDIPWREMIDMRNRVTHGYFDIDLDVVWNTVIRDIPQLEESIRLIQNSRPDAHTNVDN